MYSSTTHLGMPLSWWRDEVFHNMYSLGELYQMHIDGIAFPRVPETSLSCSNPK